MTTAAGLKNEPKVDDVIAASFREKVIECRLRDADGYYPGLYYGLLRIGGSRWAYVYKWGRSGIWAVQLSTVAILDAWGEKWFPVSELVGEPIEERYPFDGYDGGEEPDVEWYTNLKEQHANDNSEEQCCQEGEAPAGDQPDTGV